MQVEPLRFGVRSEVSLTKMNTGVFCKSCREVAHSALFLSFSFCRTGPPYRPWPICGELSCGTTFHRTRRPLNGCKWFRVHRRSRPKRTRLSRDAICLAIKWHRWTDSNGLEQHSIIFGRVRVRRFDLLESARTELEQAR